MPTAEVTCADANKFVIVDVVIALACDDGLPWNVMVKWRDSRTREYADDK